MELPDNMNSEVENFSSSAVNFHGFMPMSGDNFSDHHHHQRCDHPSFMCMHDDTNQRFNFIGDQQQQSGSVLYDPINHLPTSFSLQSFMNSDPLVFTPGSVGQNKSYGGGRKRKKNDESGVEKPREVVHVRAKRGEATDSHSLAERMRREKINEKLRRLQDLVPGCYKTMGMSVMLDVIINYVRSLQNQIEFLSMKLSAASMFYDFNSEMDTNLDTMNKQQQGTNLNGYEAAQVMERMMVGSGGEGYGDFPRFHSTWSS